MSGDMTEYVVCFHCQTPVDRDRADRGAGGELYCRKCPRWWSR